MNNDSSHLRDIDAGRLSRRMFLHGGLAATAAAGFASTVLAAQHTAGAPATPAVPGATATPGAAGGYEARLKELGITLPEVPPPVANYVAYRVSGNLAYIAGQLAFKDGKLMHPGKIPTDVSIEQGQEAAQQCIINMIAALKAACDGDLDRVKMCLRLEGFVASADDFDQQPQVMNGASNFMVEVFGDVGRHARIAVGVNTLPLNASVEVAGVFEIG